ncbi:alpha-ketoglutarate-dependent dioxygenase AlkB [Bizionia saleffrena]|uniref:Alpha-ketoglutarate-dependent dioxygenase AlkB n=1 Tax=Bizionia saleffrena TaxID=291189 RepID=A0A8H2LCY4_9FLAO|nr:alpha-ketoglutarate-dependent dioxygenase AlkB [Bizionia saleffrena]TYB70481.1 alpha-ketoglutarate-dependent dioxygenase AlkB [Bizionia saleffrena]
MLFPSEEIRLNLPDAEISYFPNFFSATEAQQYYHSILNTTHWQHDDITVFGKTHKQPRLTALFALNNNSLKYSNITMHPSTFTPTLKEIKSKIERVCNIKFTTCLANLYRDGEDSNGWHADNEKQLGRNPVIASVTFGQPRFFHLKHRTHKELRHKLLLENGSLLLMQGETQHHWLHQIAKTKRKINPRINLTFRVVE